MDFVTKDAGLVDAELRLGAVAEFRAGGEEGIVADGLVDRELRMRNFAGEKFGAAFDGHHIINGAGHDLRGDGDFYERIGIEGGANCGSHRENGANARIAMRFGIFR